MDAIVSAALSICPVLALRRSMAAVIRFMPSRTASICFTARPTAVFPSAAASRAASDSRCTAFAAVSMPPAAAAVSPMRRMPSPTLAVCVSDPDDTCRMTAAICPDPSPILPLLPRSRSAASATRAAPAPAPRIISRRPAFISWNAAASLPSSSLPRTATSGPVKSPAAMRSASAASRRTGRTNRRDSSHPTPTAKSSAAALTPASDQTARPARLRLSAIPCSRKPSPSA